MAHWYPRKSIRVLLKVMGSYLFVLLVAGLLAPVVYNWLNPFLHQKFERYVDRLRYVGLLMLLPVWWHWAKVESARALGWTKGKAAILITLMGIFSVLATGVTMALLGEGMREISMPVGFRSVLELLDAAKLVLGALVGACVVSFVEEFIFRGLLQRVWVSGFGRGWGVWLGALFFAWLHGRPEMTWVPGAIRLQDGLQLAGCYITELPANITPVELINLTLLGGVLGLIYQKTKSLLIPIGLHAGIVLAVALYNPVATLLGLQAPAEKLVAMPAATLLLSLWVVGAVVWPERADGNDAA